MAELNSRIERTEERIRELDKAIETIQSEEQKENWWEKNEQSLREIWDYNKRSGIHVIRVPGERRKYGAEKYLKKL